MAWSHFVESFAEEFQAKLATFLLVYRQTPELSVSCFVGATNEEYRTFVEKWAVEDPWVQWMQQNEYAEGVIRRSNEICPDEELEETRYYKEFLAPRDWHYGCGVVVKRTEHYEALLSFLRPKALGPLRDEELETIGFLVPHLQRAVRTHSRVRRLETEREAYLEHINQMRNGFFLVAETGMILLANKAGQEILDRRDGLVAREGRLRAVNRIEESHLAEAIRKSSLGVEAGSDLRAGFAISRGVGELPYWMLIWPIYREAGTLIGSARPTATILVIDPERRPKLEEERIAKLFGLTAAEARLACRLTEGEDVVEASSALGVSPHTARTHLKRIFSKTGVRRQSELIALVLRLGEAISQPVRSQGTVIAGE